MWNFCVHCEQTHTDEDDELPEGHIVCERCDTPIHRDDAYPGDYGPLCERCTFVGTNDE